MGYQLDADQLILQEAAGNFFHNEVSGALIRELEKSDSGFSNELWAKMAELGWMGLAVPQAYGGYGASFLDLAVVLEQLGRSGLASPYFSTCVLGVSLLEIFGSEQQKQAILPGVAAGETKLTLAYAGGDEPVSAADFPVLVSCEAGIHRLNGACLMVPFAQLADYIICAARDKQAGLLVYLLPRETAGLVINPLPTTAEDRQCELVFDDVRLDDTALLGPGDDGWPAFERLIQRAAVAKCAEMIGGARRAMEITVDYSRERVQFGRPIGAFQAVQHHCANMLTNLETSALITRYTCREISEGRFDRAQAARCKAWVSDACRELLALAHQVYAGMGFMEESDLQIYFRRIKSGEFAFGNSTFQREIVAREIGL